MSVTLPVILLKEEQYWHVFVEKRTRADRSGSSV